MNANRRRWTSPLLTAALAASAVSAAACGSGAAPAAGAPPASRHATAERAATLNWLAKTNQMWEKDDFSALDQVTTGEARSAYLAQMSATRSDPGPSGRGPLFKLTSVSITVPCHTGAESTFVAYGDTDVFTLGQSMQPVALVFQRAGVAWKLATVVNHSGSGTPSWPVPNRDRHNRPGGPGASGLRRNLDPSAEPRRDRRHRDRRRGGTLRRELVLLRLGLI